jgi:hypothetical protein
MFTKSVVFLLLLGTQTAFLSLYRVKHDCFESWTIRIWIGVVFLILAHKILPCDLLQFLFSHWVDVDFQFDLGISMVKLTEHQPAWLPEWLCLLSCTGTSVLGFHLSETSIAKLQRFQGVFARASTIILTLRRLGCLRQGIYDIIIIWFL